MEKIELLGGETALPVFLFDYRDVPPPIEPGFYFSFQEPGVDDEVDTLGPYPSRDAAFDAAEMTAHRAIRERATNDLLSFTREIQ